MRRSPPAAPQPGARLPPRVQAPVRIAQPHAVVRLLAELVAVAPAELAEEPLERRPTVVAHEVLRDQLSGMLRQPEHDRMARRNPPLD
eukprot:15451635-Alexandrium_andersonii.AAC.1